VDATAAEFAALFESVQSWARWGIQDELGALNRLTPNRVAATRLVRSGIAVSLSLPLNTSRGPACPTPAVFHMTQAHDADVGLGSMGFAKDFAGVDYHSDGHTHIDALCHVAYEGLLYSACIIRAVSSIPTVRPEHARTRVALS
jgi:hypothetical protein